MKTNTTFDRYRKPHVDEVLDDVSLPLANLEYTIEQYLLAHGARLDTETRFLLAGVRDAVGRVAGSTRRMTAETGEAA